MHMYMTFKTILWHFLIWRYGIGIILPFLQLQKKIHELNYIYLSKLWYMYVHIRIMKQRVMFGNEGDIKCKAVNWACIIWWFFLFFLVFAENNWIIWDTSICMSNYWLCYKLLNSHTPLLHNYRPLLHNYRYAIQQFLGPFMWGNSFNLPLTPVLAFGNYLYMSGPISG